MQPDRHGRCGSLFLHLSAADNDAGLSEVEGGWLGTTIYLGYMLGVFTAASLNSLHQKYLLHKAFLVLSVLTSAGMALTDNLVIWAILRFVAGTCAAGGLIIASGLILKWLVHNHHRPELGIHFCGAGLGIIVVAVLAEGLLRMSATWQQQWLVLAFTAAVLAIPAWLWLPDPTADNPESTAPVKDTPPAVQYRFVLLAAYFCAGYGFVVNATFIVDIVEGLEALQRTGQFIFILIGICATPAALLWDRIARRIGYLKSLLLAYVIQAMGILLSSAGDSLLVILLSAVLYGGTFIACVSLVLTMAGQFYPSNPAKFMGKMTLAYGVAQIIAPVCTGYLAQSQGNYNAGIYLSAFVMMVGALLIFRLLILENRSNS
jgi:MFS family permease